MDERTIRDILDEDDRVCLNINRSDTGIFAYLLLRHSEELTLHEILLAEIVCELDRLRESINYIGDILEHQ